MRETLDCFRLGSPEARRDRVLGLLAELGSDWSAAHCRPCALSGDQYQRAAFAVEACLLILDEPSPALELAAQAATIATLRRLLAARPRAMLILSYDPAMLTVLVDWVALLGGGRFGEDRVTAHWLSGLIHPPARALRATLGPDARPPSTWENRDPCQRAH